MAINIGRRLEGTAYGVLNELLATYSREDGGVALTSRFEVMIHPPTGYRGDNANASSLNSAGLQMGEKTGSGDVKNAALRCSQITFPGRTLDTVADTNLTGPVRNLVTDVSYGTVTANFQCSPDMREKLIFETWQKLAYNTSTWNTQYYHNYIGALDIYSLDSKHRRKYGVQLIDCFPTAIGEQTLDAAQGQLQLVGVTFTYRYWKNLTDEADLPKPLQERISDLLVDNIQRNITANVPAVFRI